MVLAEDEDTWREEVCSHTVRLALEGSEPQGRQEASLRKDLEDFLRISICEKPLQSKRPTLLWLVDSYQKACFGTFWKVSWLSVPHLDISWFPVLGLQALLWGRLREESAEGELPFFSRWFQSFLVS